MNQLVYSEETVNFILRETSCFFLIKLTDIIIFEMQMNLIF